MGEIANLGRAFLRDYVIEGVPASGANQPDKSLGRQAFEAIDRRIARLGVPVNNKVAFLGDSITASAVYNDADNIRNTARGMLFWVPSLTRQAFQSDQSLNFGVAGDTTAGALARVPQVIASGAGTCVVLIGTNDLGGDVAATKANLAGIYKALTDAGILTLAMTILPRTTPGTLAYGWMNTINQWIRQQEANFPYLRVIDPSAVFGDPYSLDNSPRAGFTYDGLHPMAIGVRYMSQPVADYLLTLRQPIARQLPTVTDHYWPVANEGGYLNQNPMFSGATGVVNAPVTGQMADNWTVVLSAGGGDISGLSVTVSKVINDASGLVAQRVEYSGDVTGGWQTIIGVTQYGLPYQEHLKAGDRVEFVVELDVPGGLPGCSGIVPFFSIQQNGVWKTAYGGYTFVSDDWTVSPVRATIRTPPLTLTHALAVGENARCDIWIYFKNTPHTGVAGAVEIVSAAVRKVV
ncbi:MULTISPECIES: SGNH/GDSL hydrolase family protein [unclassified Brevundimonas]|uniref:SGNH/GDSL hydrolase family protein n=1 Tax=unclassified Brevundimonas TaxID=2622653 RepID=UPI0025C09729|nr:MULTISPECIES: SGNH/GDSL hydrolase family protein [unclassified Brevundimonas]